MLKKIVPLMVLSLCAFAPWPISLNAAPYQITQDFSLDSYIQDEMTKWKIPGAAIAVIEKGKVIFMQTYGIRDIRQKSPINDNTRFVLGPCSQLFTSTALLFLADRGLLDLDKPIIDYLPQFRLNDPWITRSATTRDLLLERLGWDNQQTQLLWKWGFARSNIIDRLGDIPPSQGFRISSKSNPVNQIISSLIIESISGISWEEFIQKYVLTPLNMHQTHVGVGNFMRDPNVAQLHHLMGDTLKIEELPEVHAVAPAYWISSSIKDMATLTQMLLERGTINQQDFMHKETADEMFRPVNALDPQDKNYSRLRQQLGPYDFICTGLQWYIHNYRDLSLIEQSGSIPGAASLVTLAPEIDLGIVVLINRNENNFPSSIKLTLLDHFLKKMGKIETHDLIDWSTILQSQAKKKEDKIKEEKRQLATSRQEDTKPRYALASYAGKYTHKAYGTVEILVDKDQMGIMAGPEKIQGNLEHWHNDVFKIKWTSPVMRSDSFINFQIDNKGNIVAASIDELTPFKKG